MSSHVPRGRQALWASYTVSFVSTVALVCFLAILSVDFATNNQPIRAVSIAGCALEIATLLMLAALAWHESTAGEHATTQELTRLRKRRQVDAIIGSVLSCLGAASTIGTVAWMGAGMATLNPIVNMQPQALMAVVVVFLLISLASEAAVFALLFLESKDSSSITVLTPPVMVESARPWPEEAASQDTKVASSVHSKYDLAGAKRDDCSMSFRSSLSISTRPNSSRNPVSSRPPSSAESQFDSWDTSAVPTPLRDAVHSRSTPQSRVPTILPPIPGSRPASPAKALDGPFLPPSPHPSQLAPIVASPDSPAGFYSPPTSPPLTRATIKTSPSFDSIPRPFAFAPTPGSSESLPIPRSYSQASLADSVSHLPSHGGGRGEANVHPLFRASSATPPPGASAGTVLTAASAAEAVQGLGRHKNSREGLRSRAGSASGTCSPRESRAGSHPAPRSRAASRDQVALGSSPLSRSSPWAEGFAARSRVSDTPSPAPAAEAASSREPSSEDKRSSEEDASSDASSAIPDFIPVAAQRRDFEGFEQRKSSRGSATPNPVLL